MGGATEVLVVVFRALVVGDGGRDYALPESRLEA